MRIKGIAKIVALTVAAVVLSLGMTGCFGGKVAATVDGTKIMEDDITAEIESMRSAYNMTDKETWAQYLAYVGETPESLRQTIIDSYVEKEVIKKAAKENNISVDSAEVNGYMESMKANFDNDAAWKAALESAGMTEEKYRQAIELSLMQQKLVEIACQDTQATDDMLLQYVSMYASYSYNGAKKSSHILFDAADTETAEKVLKQVKSGSIKFEDAAKQYSKDTASAVDGGNVGWDCLSNFVAEYTNALKELKPGQVSGLVTSQFGIHIIKCTEEFNAPEEITSLSQVPEEMVESVRQSANSYAKQTAFEEWLSTYKDSSNVVVNPMPSGLSYDVDMSAYTSAAPAANEAANTEATNTEATDNAANEAKEETK